MNHLFHVITIVFIIKELIWIITPIEQTKSNQKYHTLGKSNKSKKWDDMDKEYRELLTSKGLFAILILSWMLFGLMTYNWVGFVSILAFNMLIIAPISKATRFNYAYTVLHWLNSIIGLSFGVFVLLNSYHLRIDLYKLLMTYFK